MKTSPPRPLAARVLLAAGAIGGPIFIAVFLVLGFLAPGYQFQRGTISGLELVGNGWIQQANFIAFGLFMAAFALGLRRELKRGRAAVLIPFLQLLSAEAVVGDGIFVHEPLHMVCDLVAFNSTLAMLALVAWRFWGDPRWRGWAAYSIATAVVMMGFLAAFGFANGHGGPAGAFEKLAVATRTTWSVLLVRRLLVAGRSLGPR
jgi:hypothetical membrane protein